MSELKKKPSGAEYKRKAKEREEKHHNVIKHTKNIETFFSKLKSNDSETFMAIQSTSAADPMQCEILTNYEQVEQPQNLSVPTPPTPPAVEVVRQSQTKLFIADSDPVKWDISNETQEYIALNGFNQNINADFSLSKRMYEDKISRFLTKTMFQKKLLNKENRPRKWLIYSPSTGKVFCGPCLLFGGGTCFGKQDVGFNDWKNASTRLESHENSCEHKTCVLILQRRSNISSRVDHELAAQFLEEFTYWREVLKRVVATVKSLASRGLPFRGHDEKLGSLHNGNYLMTLELLAEFDPFLSKHIAQYGGKGKGCTNYLSSTICDEFIELMANKILTQIKDEIKISKYYSIIVDSTPDISHIDQLTFMIRYVQADGTPVERFLKFIPNVGHKSQNIADAIIKLLYMFEINISDCRGQSYDNAANMSGIYNGLQAKIKELCPLADYIPCSAHSLNLVGECAAECTQEACWFFGLLQEIYTFFTASTQRWEILQEQILSGNKTKTTVKNPSVTRWSARADACKSLKESFSEILDALIAIETNPEQKRSTICEAKGIRVKLERLETAFMIVFWGFILVHMNNTNKKLQSVDIDICTVIRMYDSLIHIISAEKENFNNYEQQALELSLAKEYEKDKKRIRKRKLTADESSEDITFSLSGREKFRVTVFLVIIDRLVVELQKRRESYSNFYRKFSFLNNLTNLSTEEVQNRASALVTMYSDDLEKCFVDECIHMRSYLTTIARDEKLPRTTNAILKVLRNEELETIYPNVDIALRMCVSTAVSNCIGERSFSCLKRVKNYLRSTMTDIRLNSLAILNIESNLLQSLNYDDVIDNFARQKCRRRNF